MTYNSDNLASVLIKMLDYVTSNECSPEDSKVYLKEIERTRLFQDTTK